MGEAATRLVGPPYRWRLLRRGRLAEDLIAEEPADKVNGDEDRHRGGERNKRVDDCAAPRRVQALAAGDDEDDEDQCQRERRPDEETEFEFGLRLILDGLERLRDAALASRASVGAVADPVGLDEA